MLWKLRNRYVEILAKRGVSLENRKRFLKNADKIGIFEDSIGNDYDIEFESEANVFCSNEEKIKEKKIFLDLNKNEDMISKINKDVLREQEKIIIKDTKEYDRQGHVSRYGRNKLHEAIMLRDMCSVKKYAENNDLLCQKDNNNLTPVELAYYEDFTEAFEYIELMLETV